MDAVQDHTREKRDPNVPYERLADAELRVREQYPDARIIRAMWTPMSQESDVHVEVYDADPAKGAQVVSVT